MPLKNTFRTFSNILPNRLTGVCYYITTALEEVVITKEEVVVPFTTAYYQGPTNALIHADYVLLQ